MMITLQLPLGSVDFTKEYFYALVSESAKSCFGVTGMSSSSVADTVKALVLGDDYSKRGVIVTTADNKLYITLHIAVGYGVNIATVSKSITHRVREHVEHATGLKVARVTVAVDDILD